MIQSRYTKVTQFLRLIVFIVIFMPFSSWAQNITVSGIVTDNNNEPIVGATVAVKNTTVGTITNISGEYSLDVPQNAMLVFQFLGYTTKEEAVNSRSKINIVLEVDAQSLDEVVIVGYGTQKKVTLTGSVAGVKGEEMRQTKNENPQNMLAGRIAGVRVWQKSAEPGAFNNNFDIRGLGSPLVVIDGVPRTTAEFQRLNSNDIEDISVLKDASAAIYGVRAANGVVLVTTKKGSTDGKTTVSYNGSFTFQKPSGMPVLADAFETMTLYNERAMNNINGGNIIYDEQDFEDYRNGTRRTTDWTSLLFSDYSPQTQHDISITGGTNKTQYYVAMGYFYQEGFFKSGDLNYDKYNLRSNISTEIAKGLKLDLNLSGINDQRNNPYSSPVDIIRNYWRQGVLYPAYADPDNTMLNYEGLDLEENTVAKMTSDISGYRKYNQKYFQSSAALNFDFGTLSSALKGLSAKALVSYDYRKDDNNIYRKEYYQYAYNPLTDSYDSKLYNSSSPNQIRREMYSKQQVLGQFILNYNNTFDDLHKVSGLLGWETQKRTGDNFYAQRDLAFGMEYLFAGVDENQLGGMQSGLNDIYELANSALIGRANYAFADRYIAEVQFRYDGSSKFAKGHQWGFFPSASVGWRVSEESFFQSVSALSFVDQLKLRASYGVLGDDGELQYDWATGYTYPAVSGNAEKGYYNQYAPGYMFGSEFVYGVSTLALPNELITWFTAHTLDLGVDFEGWDGLFGFSFDYFDRRRKGRFARRSGDLPTVVGATAPRENLDSDRHYGMDLELSHRNKIGDFQYKVKAIGTITRQKYMTASEKGPYGNSYDQWRNDNLTNRYQGVVFGYESAGRFENWDDIWSYSLYKERNVLPGDYKYLDWNGDGQIDGLDEHPIAYDQTPWLNFSLNYECSYKNFDMNLLFQGSALGSMEYKEPLYSIWGSNGGGTLVQYLDRWHPVDPTADPYDPETEWVSGYYGYTGNYPRSNSEFNRVSTAYLRLKSVELGYTLPTVKALPSMNLRVFANAYNLFTITGVKFVDPEHPDDDLGRMYPLSKTFTLGVSATF
ncbi:TonB-dependent receptor [Maribellus sp. YY47]|uniref:SusC/RagA family TonB-linked outer membrane protein n=1 Tax=Maribellus sp. YY47 TaxID=2929486 RepID=UPI002000DB47|nr:TonB-dependent receptor [Maribellus sp. YY47]MCK3682876.1 TonB-dependent receptor [Maribellus sp. YY47]